MLKKVHFRLTLLGTGVTGGILILTTLIYLFVWENNLWRNRFQTFQSDMNNVVSSLENTTVISGTYLSSLEAGGRYLVYLEDNGMPFLYGNIVENEERQEKQALLTEVKDYYEDHFDDMPKGLIFAYHTEFIYEKRTSILSKDKFYVCAAILSKEQGQLSLFIISPQTSYQKQMIWQWLFFALINLLAILFLYLFFYRLTGYALRPVKESTQKQERFIASASHELRTPLSVILSCAALIPSEDKKEQKRLCDIIENEGGMMKRLLNEMLLSASLSVSQIALEKEETEADTLLLNCVEAFEPMANEKGLTLSALLPEEAIPPLYCDKHKIEQTLSILLHNAISYTERGGSINASLSYHKNGKRHFVFSVADTGIGISDGDKKQIFERFYRSDESRSEKEHFGLGLSIAKEIVEGHKGSIKVKDTPGGGSTFIIELI